MCSPVAVTSLALPSFFGVHIFIFLSVQAPHHRRRQRTQADPTNTGGKALQAGGGFRVTDGFPIFVNSDTFPSTGVVTT